MVAINRVRVPWSGGSVVGPGLTTFYLASGVTDVTPIKSFFNAVGALFPTTCQWQIPSSGDTIEATTGALLSTWTGTGGGSESGRGSGAFALGVGARIEWRTSEIRAGRRVRGSTFMVPLLNASFEGTSGLAPGTVSTLATAATALITAYAGSLRVWSRPRPGLVGADIQIDAAVVPDAVSWLRSRRV